MIPPRPHIVIPLGALLLMSLSSTSGCVNRTVLREEPARSSGEVVDAMNGWMHLSRLSPPLRARQFESARTRAAAGAGTRHRLTVYGGAGEASFSSWNRSLQTALDGLPPGTLLVLHLADVLDEKVGAVEVHLVGDDPCLDQVLTFNDGQLEVADNGCKSVTVSIELPFPDGMKTRDAAGIIEVGARSLAVSQLRRQIAAWSSGRGRFDPIEEGSEYLDVIVTDMRAQILPRENLWERVRLHLFPLHSTKGGIFWRCIADAHGESGKRPPPEQGYQTDLTVSSGNEVRDFVRRMLTAATGAR